jgi:hypothetical protein
MRTSIRFVVGVAVSVVLMLAVVVRPASAQATALTAADAAKFAGEWVLALDTPQGAMSMNLTLKNAEGKLAGTLSSDIAPEQAVTDITKDGDNLVLKYTLDFQGQAIPAMITLKPSGTKWSANFDFAGGQFNMDGTATKK